MGGWGSGRTSSRAVKEESKVIDLAMMLRKGWIAEGCKSSGRSLSWSRGAQLAGSISYDYDLTDPDNATLRLHWRSCRAGGDWVRREQVIRLVYTRPHYGGRRWWMICPVRGDRVAKLYLPHNGDIFAGRKAWRIAYRSQRVADHDKPFERLNRLQRKLGCREGYDEWLFRPKGMWHRTFARHQARFEKIHEDCDMVWIGLMARIGMFKGVT